MKFVSETLVYLDLLTWLWIWQDFIEFSHHESFKTCILFVVCWKREICTQKFVCSMYWNFHKRDKNCLYGICSYPCTGSIWLFTSWTCKVFITCCRLLQLLCYCYLWEIKNMAMGRAPIEYHLYQILYKSVKWLSVWINGTTRRQYGQLVNLPFFPLRKRRSLLL